MRKPNFFIVGAPKCGTTSVATWLAGHKDVFITHVKEPHHFNTDMKLREFTDVDQYEQLFNGAANHVAVGEASVWYLYSNDAVANIEDYAGEPRYIVCIRNPVEMAHSLHEQQIFSGNEDRREFEAAWRLCDDRRAGENIPKHSYDHSTLIYSHTCALGTQLQQLFEKVPRDRIHVVILDDLKADARFEFEKIQEFLGVIPDPAIELPVVNSAKVRRSHLLHRATRFLGSIKTSLGVRWNFHLLKKMDKLNRKEHRRSPMDPTLRTELIDFFEEEIVLLEKLLERDLAAWRQ